MEKKERKKQEHVSEQIEHGSGVCKIPILVAVQTWISLVI
jgi:hypothetical protein